MAEEDQSRLVLPAFITLSLIGGANAVAVRFTIRELAPFWSASLRFALAGSVFLGVMAIKKIPFPTGRGLIGDVWYGVLGFGLSYSLFYWGVQTVSAGVAQVVMALVPLVTVFLAALHGLERITRRGIAGALLALAGFIVVFGDQLSADVQVPAMIALLLASVVTAETGVVVKWFPRTNPVAKNAVGMASGAAFNLVLSLLFRESLVVPRMTETWVSLLYLVIPGSVFVFTLFLFILNRWTASASSYQFVVLPFVTIFYGAILLGERVTPVTALGAGLVILGVYVGGIQQERKKGDVIPSLPEQTPAHEGVADRRGRSE